MMDMCRLLDTKNIGKEWVNLGYRFEALESNELYEELEDEFEVTAEESNQSSLNVGTSRLQVSELDDWSYCLLPRQTVVGKKLRRLNFF